MVDIAFTTTTIGTIVNAGSTLTRPSTHQRRRRRNRGGDLMATAGYAGKHRGQLAVELSLNTMRPVWESFRTQAETTEDETVHSLTPVMSCLTRLYHSFFRRNSIDATRYAGRLNADRYARYEASVPRI